MAATAADRPRNVLVLHSYHQGLPWTDSEQEGLLAGLGEHRAEFALYIEYLDALRFPLPNNEGKAELARRLAERYASAGIDILIATDDPAYQLLLAQRDRLWPGRPILFAGVNNIRSSDLAGVDGVAGVSEAPDFPANLELIQKLHPTTSRLVVVGDGTQTFASNLATLEAANAELAQPFAIEVVTHRLLDEVLRDLQALSGDFVVLLMGRPFDRLGRIVPESESAAALRRNTVQPMYSPWSFFLGHGIVGGKLVSGKDQGMAVATLAVGLHSGQTLADLPRLIDSPNRYIFDYKELHRFGLTGRALPPGSVVINRPEAIWDAYPRISVGAVALMIFLLALLVLQARNLRTKRHLSAKVEKELVLVQALMSAVPFPMFFQDVSLSYQRYNKAFADLLDSSRQSSDACPAEAAKATPPAFLPHGGDEDLLASGGQQVYQTTVTGVDHERRDVVVHKAVVRLPNGRVEGIVGAMIDVTELQRVEHDLRELNLHLEQRVAERTAELQRQQVFIQAVLENISDGIVACDENGRLTVFNRASREMHGMLQEDLPSEQWARHYRLFRADGVTPMSREDIPLFRAFQGEIVRNEQMTLQTASGEALVVLASGQAITDHSGARIGAVVSLHDITEQKIVEARLRDAKDAAEAANRAKSSFLANMSHELRTPLSAILGFSALMRRDGETATDTTFRDREHLAIINRSGEYLLGLINDILDMAKIETGRIQLAIAPFDLGTSVHEIVDMMSQRAHEKGLELRLEQSARVVRHIRGDEVRLRQVLVNLLGNAIKFTQQGTITLRLDGLPDDSQPWLSIEVEDSGPGIAAQDQARIFEPFVQVGQASGQRGTGLGLAISRQLVQLMGGRISVSSQPGLGSRFRIDLPVDPATPCEIAASLDQEGEIRGLESGQPAWRLLIVEDQPESALLLSRLLSDAGFQVRTAEDGQRGVEVFAQWQPHFIWMDRRMPVMDGLEATRCIRALAGGDEVKIVALTASVFIDQHREMLSAGVDEILHKPYRPRQLFDCLARHLGARYVYRRPAAPAAPSPEVRVDLAMRAGKLPEDLRQALLDASIALDSGRIDRLIDRVAEIDPLWAEDMRRQADRFDYEAIEKDLRSKQ